MKYFSRLNRIRPFETCALLAIACIVQSQVAAPAQDATSTSDGGDASASSSGPVLNVPHDNSLEGLFTGQRQFPTAQTLTNPQPAAPAAGEINPLRRLFTPPNQWSTPQTVLNPDSQPPDGEVNHLKGVFTPGNTFATPQTVLNPHATPRNLVPERQFLWGGDDVRNSLLLQHAINTYGSATSSQDMPGAGTTQQAAKPPQSNTKKGKAAPPPKTPGTPAAQKQTLAIPPAASNEHSPLKMSLSLMRTGENEKSLQLLEQILREHPEDASAHYLKAVILVRMKQYKNAADQYNEVIRLNPGTQLSTYAREGLTKIGF